MTERAWQDQIVGDRMKVDQEFGERIHQSGFTRQQWSLVMTAIDFEIEGGGDSAKLVADTSKLDAILPEIERMRAAHPTPGVGDQPSGGGLLDSLKSTLGLGGGIDAETRAEAEELADAYATALQAQLESTGKWAAIADEE